jgi:hypothetical protein
VQKLIEQILCDIESTKEILKIEREGGY